MNQKEDKKDKFLSRKQFILRACIVVLILIIVISIWFYNKSDNKEGIITLSDELTRTRYYDSMKIIDVKSYKENKNIHFRFTIENITDKDREKGASYIIFFDENKRAIKKENILVPDVKAHSISIVDLILEKDILKAADFKISDV